jgi:uncharacterized protein (TIGR02466 family)
MEVKVSRQEIFPTTIWSFDLSFLREYFPAWLELVQDWRQKEPAAGRSNRQGWNSDLRVMQMALFAPLEQAARAGFNHAFNEMKLTTPVSFRLEGWINALEQGGYNLPHHHPNRLLSGCFYLQVPERSAPLTLIDPRPAVGLTAMPGQGANCGGLAHVPPFAGQLLLFPHWLEHQVDNNQSGASRISVGINACLA